MRHLILPSSLLIVKFRTLPGDLSTSGIKERKTRGEFREEFYCRGGIRQETGARGIGSRNVRIFLWTSVQPRLHRVREKRSDPRFVSSNRAVDKNSIRFVSAKVKIVRNRIVRGGPTNRDRLSLMVVPFFR